MNSELFIAEMEDARNRVEESYFDARPQSDTLGNRSLFRAAFERGFNQGYAFSLRPTEGKTAAKGNE